MHFFFLIKSCLFYSDPKSKTGIIIGIASVITLLISLLVFLTFRIVREKKLTRKLQAAGLANFEEGNPGLMNPNLYLDEQADLLPYKREFEFPREKLILGSQLGAGAFGVVLKGIAKGICPYQEETTVAVKMVKKMTDNDLIRSLDLELKIMIHIGQHLNVVNLLGAVTKNIARRELMVIVEYCKFGSLQSYLVNNRSKFFYQPSNNECGSENTSEQIDSACSKTDIILSTETEDGKTADFFCGKTTHTQLGLTRFIF